MLTKVFNAMILSFLLACLTAAIDRFNKLLFPTDGDPGFPKKYGSGLCTSNLGNF